MRQAIMGKIISEHKKIPKNRPVNPGYKRVEAIVSFGGFINVTRHIDIKK